MTDTINQELANLQTELANLGNAVSQITKAEKISTDMLAAVQDMQKKYDVQFDKISTYFENYLSQTAKTSADTIQKTAETHNAGVENAQQSLAQISTNTQNLLSETQSQIGVLVENHSSQITEINNLLQSYLQLAQSTTSLSVQIEKVDFPTRLDKITVNIGEMNSEIRQIQAHLKSIADDPILINMENRIRKNNKKINLLTVLIIAALVLLTGLTYEILILKYFPGLGI
jgi:hypothetical protein